MSTTTDGRFSDHDVRVRPLGGSESGMSVPARRRPLLAVPRLLAAALALLLFSGFVMAVFTMATPAGNEPVEAGASVPDVLLLHTWDSAHGPAGLQAFLPGSTEAHAIAAGLSVTAEPVISPDGRTVLVAGWEQIGNTFAHGLLAVDSETLALKWAVDLGSEERKPGYYGPSTSTFVAASNDHAYAIRREWETASPLTIAGYSLDDAQLSGAWTVDLGGAFAGVSSFFVSPDGSSLHAFVAKRFSSVYYRFSLPDMRETGRFEQQGTLPWGLKPAGDSSLLYAINTGDPGAEPSVSFFDLARGSLLPPVTLPFQDRDIWFLQHATSHDGATLYLLNPFSGELAIVDLLQQRLVQMVEVDVSQVQANRPSLFGRAWNGLRALVVSEATAKVHIGGTMQLSPDGTRLYAIGASGSTFDDPTTGVLVINTGTWQVEQHWASDINPVQLVLGGDGRQLYALTFNFTSSSTGAILHIIDTTSGVLSIASDELGAGTIATLSEIYRTSFGVAPAVRGVTAGESGPITTVPLARIEVTLDNAEIAAGDTVAVDVRFVDPASGQIVEPDGAAYRFDEPSSLQATLAHTASNVDPVIVELAREGFGHYRGTTRLDSAGLWSAHVSVAFPEAPSRRATVRDAVLVQPTYTGSDGQRYGLQLTLDTPNPGVASPVTAQLRIVNALTDEPMPANVELLSGLPDALRVGFSLPGYGVTTSELRATGHGVYSGAIAFSAPGTWQAQTSLRDDTGRQRSIVIGAFEVR